jgi:hypothetical protein
MISVRELLDYSVSLTIAQIENEIKEIAISSANINEMSVTINKLLTKHQLSRIEEILREKGYDVTIKEVFSPRSYSNGDQSNLIGYKFQVSWDFSTIIMC